MLIRFSSIKTEPITMFGNIAVQLIKMMGASGSVPGAIAAEDIPAAIQRLRLQLQAHAAPELVVSEPQNEQEKERETPIGLATRAGPLIDLLERAGAGGVPLMWEAQ